WISRNSWCPTEFADDDEQRLVKQTSHSEVLDQCGQSLIEARQHESKAELARTENAALLNGGTMVVPARRGERRRVNESLALPGRSRPGIDGNQTYACLHKSSRQQEVLTEWVAPITVASRFRLAAQVKRLPRRRARRQLHRSFLKAAHGFCGCCRVSAVEAV